MTGGVSLEFGVPPLLCRVVRVACCAMMLGALFVARVDGEDLPYADSKVDYFSMELDHPLGELIRAGEKGEAKLNSRGKSELLTDVLKALQIPVESQLLVYSKTSVNGGLVSPKRPRAIYFNEDSYVAWIPESAVIEIAVVDPRKGAMFYTLDQKKSPVEFQRQTRCLDCHVGKGTAGVPGLLMKSVTTDEAGHPLTSLGEVKPGTPWKILAGGWYVSGAPVRFAHAGVTLPWEGASATGLEREWYPGRGSDVIALGVLKHQVEVQNLLIRLRYEHVLGKRVETLDAVVGALLFQGEAAWPTAVERTEFARVFEAGGSSLRALNLKTRLFERRVSYLIRGKIVREYPVELRGVLLEEVKEELEGVPEGERDALLREIQ